jgi:hypothetical protein
MSGGGGIIIIGAKNSQGTPMSPTLNNGPAKVQKVINLCAASSDPDVIAVCNSLQTAVTYAES